MNGLTVTGTVYTKCVYTVPVATKEPYFLYFSVSHSNEWSYSNRNGVYGMCVHRSRSYERTIFSIFFS